MNLIIGNIFLEINKLLSSIKKNSIFLYPSENWIYIKAANKEKYEAYVVLLRNFTKHLRKEEISSIQILLGNLKKGFSMYFMMFAFLWCQKYFKKTKFISIV